MKKFLVIFEQAGEGCDYTIGCGTLVDEIEAETMQEAFDQAMANRGWDDYLDYSEPFYDREDGQMSSVVIYEIAQEDSQMFDAFCNRVRVAFHEQQQLEQRQHDEEKLHKLAAKLGKRVI